MAQVLNTTTSGDRVFWGGSATQHLSAGAHLDPVFRRTVLNHVFRRRYRELAPSYGFAPLPVVHHARVAHRADLIRDGALLLLQLLVLVVRPQALTVVYLLLGGWLQTVVLIRIVTDLILLVRGGAPLRAFRALWIRLVGTVAAYFFLWIPLTVLVSLIAAGDALNEALAEQQGVPGGIDQGSDQLVPTGLVVTIGLLLLVSTCVIAAALRQVSLDQIARSADLPPSGTDVPLTELAQKLPGEVITYSGFEPFIGTGPVQHEWSFTHRLVPDLPTGELAPEALDRVALPFTGKDIVDHLRGRLELLRTNPLSGQGLTGFTLQDAVYLSDLYTYPVPPGPFPAASRELIIEERFEQLRHYLVLQVHGWRGEVIATVYVRVSVQGGMLYVEFSARALPPTRSEYHLIDDVTGVGAAGMLRSIWHGVRDSPKTVWFAPVRLVRSGYDAIGGALARWSAATSPAAAARRFGPKVSIREEGSSPPPYHYFQLSDVERFTKTVERRLLADLIAYLGDQGVDVTEFEQRAVAILNYGVQHFGVGDVNAVDAAVGPNAQVTKGDGGTPRP